MLTCRQARKEAEKRAPDIKPLFIGTVYSPRWALLLSFVVGFSSNSFCYYIYIHTHTHIQVRISAITDQDEVVPFKYNSNRAASDLTPSVTRPNIEINVLLESESGDKYDRITTHALYVTLTYLNQVINQIWSFNATFYK